MPVVTVYSAQLTTRVMYNANSDTVSVIDTAADAVVNTLHVGEAIQGRQPVLGSSPNAVAVSSDGVRLFVTDLGFNRVLIWNSIPTANHAPADVVVGRPT